MPDNGIKINKKIVTSIEKNRGFYKKVKISVFLYQRMQEKLLAAGPGSCI